MKVDPAEAGDVEQASGDDLPVGDDNDGVGIGLAEEVLGFGSANFFGLEDLDVGGECGFFYCGVRDFVAAAAGAVGLSDDRGDLKVLLGKEMLQRRDGELWGATEQ